MERSAHNSNYVVVSLNRPLLWSRTSEEVWQINPPRRYVINADHVEAVAQYVDTISDLKTSAHYKPLDGKVNLVKSKILVERCRDRGIGDLLFLTGVFAYLQHISSYEAQIYIYSLSDRGQCLAANPSIVGASPLYGPIEYNDLLDFDYHWFIENVTEHDEEKEQLNVYDALFKGIGVDPAIVHPSFKRPYAYLTQDDMVNLDAMFYHIAHDRKIDLRHVPYYTVAPLANGNLRASGYKLWLDTIDELAKHRPVIVLGRINEGKMANTDMSFGAFMRLLATKQEHNPNIINLMGVTPLRIVMGLISRSLALVSLDSGLLYVAQGFRVPAISLWGTHNPAARIGYDTDYMDLAIWNKDACRCAPCYAYHSFPALKCPDKGRQTTCEVLKVVQPGHILERMKQVELNLAKRIKSGTQA